MFWSSFPWWLVVQNIYLCAFFGVNSYSTIDICYIHSLNIGHTCHITPLTQNFMKLTLQTGTQIKKRRESIWWRAQMFSMKVNIHLKWLCFVKKIKKHLYTPMSLVFALIVTTIAEKPQFFSLTCQGLSHR